MTEGHMPHQIVVRVDDVLLAALRTDAVDHGRTVAQSVRHLLRLELSLPTHLGSRDGSDD